MKVTRNEIASVLNSGGNSKYTVPAPAVPFLVKAAGLPQVKSALKALDSETVKGMAAGSVRIPRALRAQLKPHYSKVTSGHKSATWLRGIIATYVATQG